MKSKLFVLLLLGGIVPVCALRSETADSLRNGKTYPIGEVVVTGTRHETDVRHLPMTISVVGRQKIAEGFQPSLLPTLTEQIPGLYLECHNNQKQQETSKRKYLIVKLF